MTDKKLERENRDRLDDASENMLSRSHEYENAVRADTVAFIMQTCCPEGQDAPYETLEKLYQAWRGEK